jgi:hypothetical protein
MGGVQPAEPEPPVMKTIFHNSGKTKSVGEVTDSISQMPTASTFFPKVELALEQRRRARFNSMDSVDGNAVASYALANRHLDVEGGGSDAGSGTGSSSSGSASSSSCSSSSNSASKGLGVDPSGDPMEKITVAEALGGTPVSGKSGPGGGSDMVYYDGGSGSTGGGAKGKDGVLRAPWMPNDDDNASAGPSKGGSSSSGSASPKKHGSGSGSGSSNPSSTSSGQQVPETDASVLVTGSSGGGGTGGEDENWWQPGSPQKDAQDTSGSMSTGEGMAAEMSLYGSSVPLGSLGIGSMRASKRKQAAHMVMHGTGTGSMAPTTAVYVPPEQQMAMFKQRAAQLGLWC